MSRLKKKALNKYKNFNARGSKCPICNKQFRNSCGHSTIEAKERLYENYIKTI